LIQNFTFEVEKIFKDSMEEKKVCPYPGYDLEGTYYTPRQAPRVKPEAQEFADKNRGSLQLFGSGTWLYSRGSPCTLWKIAIIGK
jgi:hypothetical protein